MVLFVILACVKDTISVVRENVGNLKKAFIKQY